MTCSQKRDTPLQLAYSIFAFIKTGIMQQMRFTRVEFRAIHTKSYGKRCGLTWLCLCEEPCQPICITNVATHAFRYLCIREYRVGGLHKHNDPILR